MHIRLTDVLICPHCGPTWPLVLLADRVDEGRVLSGTLGCPNCRAHFAVSDGYADFGGTAESEGSLPADEDAARLAALLGITEGPALALVIGSGAVNALGIARVVPGLEVVAAWTPSAAQEESEGVTRMGIGAALPLRDASMRGVALTDSASERLLSEACRVVAPRGRVVVFNGAASAAERLEAAGLRVLARDEHTTVAVRAAF